MINSVLADLVLALHLVFIIFVVVGGLLALYWHRMPLLHLPAALWGIYIEVSGGICPLTPLENTLRQQAGGSGYSGGFIQHYLVPAIYPEALTQPVQHLLAGLVVLVNTLVYWFIWRRYKSARDKRKA